MIHHGENLPTKHVKQNQKLSDDLDEKCLAEMLFYMEQMRRLVRKYDKVVKTNGFVCARVMFRMTRQLPKMYNCSTSSSREATMGQKSL